MPRRIMLGTSSGDSTLLLETPAENEKQLQELVKANPDLLPIDDLAMSGPLAVIGRETVLQSGAVDLVALTRSGHLLVIEFKTGLRNADFRAALAQLVDYGSDIWGQSFDVFERSVALRYFASDHCPDPALRKSASLREALGHIWEDFTDEDYAALVDTLEPQVTHGTMHYLLLAQRFTPPILRTIEYLNEVAKPRFYAIEVVRFVGDAMEAFESRVVQRPRSNVGGSSGVAQSELEFLSQFEGSEHADAVNDLVREVQALGYTVFLGTIGVSIRVPVPDRPEPLSVAWLNPPGRSGWLGLTDLALGYDARTTAKMPTAEPIVKRFFSRVGEAFGLEPESHGSVQTIHLPPSVIVDERTRVTDLLRELRDDLEGVPSTDGSTE